MIYPKLFFSCWICFNSNFEKFTARKKNKFAFKLNLTSDFTVERIKEAFENFDLRSVVTADHTENSDHIKFVIERGQDRE